MNKTMLRYGVFGGSFDPLHYGHLALAETARVQLQLDLVLFVPVGQQPIKQSHTSSAADRAAMVERAIADNPGFALSRVDLDRSGPHYTVDTLGLLREQHPDVATWYFLMGEDSLHELPKWREPEGILQQATLGVMPRVGQRADVLGMRAHFPLLAERLIWLDVPPLHISATDLRLRVRKSLPLRYLVPPTVAAYIEEHQLYMQ